jgi:tRNA threonylcarbamoyl adenosine modification protein YeaZ
MAKYGLALHTSSPGLGLAIGNLENNTCRTQSWPLGRDTSNVLHSYLVKFMTPQAWQDLAWVAVAIGPGGFTGTRLAVVTARTIGQQLQIPVFGISSLAAIAWSQQIDGTLAVEIPAQRGQIHAGIYVVNHQQSQLAVQQIDRVTTISDWEAVISTMPVQRISIASGADVSDTVSAVWELAQRQWQQGDRSSWELALPVYGQSPV